MNQENQVSLKEFNMVAGSLQSVWYALDMKGYYLPEISCQAMTSEYLLEVLRGKFLELRRKKFKNALLYKGANLKQKTKDLSFTLAKLLNIQWLISVLYALNSYDQEFLKPKKTDGFGLVKEEDLGLSFSFEKTKNFKENRRTKSGYSSKDKRAQTVQAQEKSGQKEI